MIYQPRNVSPSSTSVDVRQDIVFSMQMQTNAYVSGYRLLLMDFNNRTIYQGSQQSLGYKAYNGDNIHVNLPVSGLDLHNGRNYKWRIRLYQDVFDMLIAYGTVTQPSSTEELNRIYVNFNNNIHSTMKVKIVQFYNSGMEFTNERTITSYNREQGYIVLDENLYTPASVGDKYYIYSNFIDTTPDYIMYARETPRVYIDNTPTKYNLQKIEGLNDMAMLHTTKPLNTTLATWFWETLIGSGVIYNDYKDNVRMSVIQYDIKGSIIDDNYHQFMDKFDKGDTVVLEDGYFYNIQFYIDGLDDVLLKEYQDNIKYVLTKKHHMFQGRYEQTDVVPIAYHQFNLYIINDDGTKELLATSGKVYSANLSYYYDALMNNVNYAIEMIVENDMGTIINSGLYYFNVIYDTIEYTQKPSAEFDSAQNANRISWATPIEHEAVVESVGDSGVTGFEFLYDTPYNTTNSLYTRGYEAVWKNEEGLCILPDDFNIALQFSVDSNCFYNNGVYSEIVPIIESHTLDAGDEGNYSLYIQRDHLIFKRGNDIRIEKPLFEGVYDTFPVSLESEPQINHSYVWLDDATWNDNGTWYEGGTFLDRVPNRWFRVQITNTDMKITEIYV